MRIAAIVVVVGLLTGCRTMTETGAAVGGGVGAVTGAALGAATGQPAAGAAIGAGVGALTGGAIGHAEDQREIAQATYERQAAAGRLGMTDIVALTQQGTDADVIANQIRSTCSTFNLSTADIQYLTQCNVSPKVITAMQNARPAQRSRVIVAEPPPAVIIAPRPVFWGPWGWGCHHRHCW